ncbi:MAG: hypothetical protein FWF50_05115 [Defluviitaleaceae bacterium]|nr:hypothetical protein [Defluviitaleaceae bacterium]
MNKISFKDFKKIMELEIYENKGLGFEIEFDIDNSEIYQSSWMGKMLDKETKKQVYWFGLVQDGSQAHEYNSFEEFVNEKVFYGEKSLKDIWDKVSIFSLNGGTCEEMMPYYLS